METMTTHYENLNRAAHHSCPRCEGKGHTSPVEGRTLPCGRCFSTGEDLLGTLHSWEADLQDLKAEWRRYNALVQAARGGKRLGLSKKLEGLTKRGQALKAAIEELKAEINGHLTPTPF